MTPEEKARQQIDLLLQQSGWIVQDRTQINLAADPGIAIREAALRTGEADYLSFAGYGTTARLTNAHQEI
jgi:type I restriction enzyme, R subunit